MFFGKSRPPTFCWPSYFTEVMTRNQHGIQYLQIIITVYEPVFESMLQFSTLLKTYRTYGFLRYSEGRKFKHLFKIGLVDGLFCLENATHSNSFWSPLWFELEMLIPLLYNLPLLLGTWEDDINNGLATKKILLGLASYGLAVRQSYFMNEKDSIISITIVTASSIKHEKFCRWRRPWLKNGKNQK